MANNPMQQFSVHKIGPEIKIAGIDLSFTNASLFMVISASIIAIFLFLGTRKKKIMGAKIHSHPQSSKILERELYVLYGLFGVFPHA